MKRTRIILLAVTLITLTTIVVFGVPLFGIEREGGSRTTAIPETAITSTSTTALEYLHYQFSVDGTLVEVGSIEESSSPYFWLNSGGELVIQNGLGETIQGPLSGVNHWYRRYQHDNPVDTDDGLRPQNIFRLLTVSHWGNVEETLRFFITRINMTDSPNRGEWSGLFLLSRYQDQGDLYYGGIRVDGQAVIKKKYNGVYYTLALTPVFEAQASYDRETNPNLIPGNSWIGLRFSTETVSDNAVRLTLWIDESDTGDWREIVSVIDTPAAFGDGVVEVPGHAGIRSDFMDVQLDDFVLREL